MSGQSDLDATPIAPEVPVSSGAKQAQLIALDASEASEWPEDCEEIYVLRVHGEETVGDATPYHVRGGVDEINSFYFDVPWQGDRQLLMARWVVDNRPIVHHWALFTVENLQGQDAAIFSGRNILDAARTRDAQLLVGGGFNPEDVRLPDEVGLQMPTKSNVGFLLEVHYFAPEEGAFVDDASAVQLCVTSKPRPRVAGTYPLGRRHFELPPHESTAVEADCVASVTEPFHIVAVAPHMHATGTHAELVLHRASGEQIVLHDHPYNFEDQQVYWLGDPQSDAGVVVGPGDTLSTTCSYDNPRDTTILSGPAKDNEMCTVITWAWPATAMDPNHCNLQ
jgi:hypothetical protein